MSFTQKWRYVKNETTTKLNQHGESRAEITKMKQETLYMTAHSRQQSITLMRKWCLYFEFVFYLGNDKEEREWNGTRSYLHRFSEYSGKFTLIPYFYVAFWNCFILQITESNLAYNVQCYQTQKNHCTIKKNINDKFDNFIASIPSPTVSHYIEYDKCFSLPFLVSL